MRERRKEEKDFVKARFLSSVSLCWDSQKQGGGPPFSCSFGAASGQNRAGLKRTRTPDPLGCVLCSWSMCVAGVL